jgi:hypothetical protein
MCAGPLRKIKRIEKIRKSFYKIENKIFTKYLEQNFGKLFLKQIVLHKKYIIKFQKLWKIRFWRIVFGKK